MPSKKGEPFRWDPLVRLTHWGLAAVCIGNLWVNEAGGGVARVAGLRRHWAGLLASALGAHFCPWLRPPWCPHS